MRLFLLTFSLLLWQIAPAFAHFGLVLPSENMIMSPKEAKCQLTIAFCHPFGGEGMDLVKPEDFFVQKDKERTSLLSLLRPKPFMDHAAFTAEYNVARPGVYQFGLVPRPYFEEAEDTYIIHYTKTILGAYGAEDGWDEPLGLPVEIIPLTRPFGNYSGNTFTGVALKNGKPLANADIEVENLNFPVRHKAPNPYFETQVVKTDANGVFTFGIPWAGWWGFAVLATSEDKLDKDGQPKDIELGGVLWVRFDSAKPAEK